MAITKKQEEFAQGYFEENTNCKELFLNPKGEWFTNSHDAENSLEKNEKGEKKAKIECIKPKVKSMNSDLESPENLTPENQLNNG